MKDLTPKTRLSFETGFECSLESDRITRHTLTVTEFIADNGDDVPFLHEMLGELIDQGWTVQGGGAAPVVRIEVRE